MSSIVSVIIPTYNRKDYVQEAIDSVLAQTYTEHEILVVDDGSTDGTGRLLEERYGPRIRYTYQENRGESAARNTAMQQSRGAYLAFLDSDDLWLPRKLERQMQLMVQRPAVGLVSCSVLRIDKGGRVLSDDSQAAEPILDPVPLERLVLLPGFLFRPSRTMIRRSCIEGMEWFREDIRYGEDREFFLRIASERPAVYIDEPLACLRVHPGTQGAIVKTKEEVEHRLADRLTRVHPSVFAAFGDRLPTAAVLRARAEAIDYATAAFGLYLHGDHARGSDLLAQAVELDPVSWGDGRRASEQIFQRAVGLADMRSEAEAVRYLEVVYNHLPAGLEGWRTEFLRRLVARLYVTLAFRHHQRAEAGGVRRCLIRGVVRDPGWLRNLGVWSIGARAYGSGLGAWAVALARRVRQLETRSAPRVPPAGNATPKDDKRSETA
ncbi:glycosyltransferase family 2 protein [Chloroflexota bacterium]